MVSIFDDSISKIYSLVEQFRHFSLHLYPFVNIDVHVIIGQVVVLCASFSQDPDYLVVLRNLLIQGVQGDNWHLADQPVLGLGPAKAAVAAAGLVGWYYCLRMGVGLGQLL